MTSENSSQDDLLEAAAAGNADAINELLARQRAELVRMVRLRLDPVVSRRLDASDIVQDVLLEANQRLSDYLRDPRLPFRVWLRRLARDRVIDAYRRHRQARRRSMDRERPVPTTPDGSAIELEQWLRDPAPTPAAAAIRQELHERFLVALDELDDVDREILLLRHFEQFTNSEAAAILDLSQPAAGMRYLRALRRVRVLLGDDQSDSDAMKENPSA